MAEPLDRSGLDDPRARLEAFGTGKKLDRVRRILFNRKRRGQGTPGFLSKVAREQQK